MGAANVDPIASWRTANREIASRLALAVAREGLVEAWWHGDALELSGLGALRLARTHALLLHEPALDDAGEPWLDDAVGTWHELARVIGCDAPTTARIAAELDDGCHRLALAVFAADTRAARLVALGPEDPRSFDAEHFITRGHPWHPMVKTRLGLGWADNVRLAPELCARAEILTVEAPAAMVRRFGDPEALASLGFVADGDSVRLPVLAAQWRRLGATLRARLVQRGGPLMVGRSLASLRTVALDHRRVHLKLALDVLTTSARRTVSPMSVANATRVTALVDRVQARDPIAAGSPPLVVMREVAAAGLDPAVVGDAARMLGVIVRDASALDRDHIVCAALGEPDADGVPFLMRLVAGYPGTQSARADAMLVDYVARLLPPVLRMWTAHGIALEAHMQNTLVRAAGGTPAGFVVRDLGGIRLHRSRVAAAGHAIALDPGSFIATDDEAEATDKLVHALVHAHLAGLLRMLAQHCEYDELRGWARIAGAIDGCLCAWAVDPALRDACERDRARLFAPQVRGKALLRMRLLDRSSDYSYVVLDNPLARPSAPIDHASTAT